MKHYLSYIDESIKANWNRPALSNYGANTLTYGVVASEIERMHLFFEKCGIKRGEKIALCARNCAEWCVAYFAIVTYDAVCVPLLADFLPQNILDLTSISDSRLLLLDKNIYANLKRDNIIPQFSGINGFCGLVDVVGLEIRENCNGHLDGVEDAVEKSFTARFPHGVTPKNVNYKRDNLDASRLSLL